MVEHSDLKDAGVIPFSTAGPDSDGEVEEALLSPDEIHSLSQSPNDEWEDATRRLVEAKFDALNQSQVLSRQHRHLEDQHSALESEKARVRAARDQAEVTKSRQVSNPEHVRSWFDIAYLAALMFGVLGVAASYSFIIASAIADSGIFIAVSQTPVLGALYAMGGIAASVALAAVRESLSLAGKRVYDFFTMACLLAAFVGWVWSGTILFFAGVGSPTGFGMEPADASLWYSLTVAVEMLAALRLKVMLSQALDVGRVTDVSLQPIWSKLGEIWDEAHTKQAPLAVALDAVEARRQRHAAAREAMILQGQSSVRLARLTHSARIAQVSAPEAVRKVS